MIGACRQEITSLTLFTKTTTPYKRDRWGYPEWGGGKVGANIDSIRIIFAS